MTKIQLAVMKFFSLKTLPSFRVLRATNWIALGLIVLLEASIARGLWQDGVEAGYSGLQLLGWMLLMMGWLGFCVGFVANAMLLVYYGPILEICGAVRAVYHGFMPFCCGVRDAVVNACNAIANAWHATCAAIARAGHRVVAMARATRKGIADGCRRIANMTAEEWGKVATVLLAFAILGGTMTLFWPTFLHFVNTWLTWMNLDKFETFGVALWLDLVCSGFLIIFALGVVQTIIAVVVHHFRSKPKSI
jgi:hypothetical protein